MTIAEAIAQADALKPNQYSTAQKTGWLSAMDWTIYREVIATHEGGDEVTYEGYTTETDSTTELLAVEPYSQLYSLWLIAQIDFFNNEIARYNNSVLMYNTAYEAYRMWYNSTYLPLQTNSLLV